jgi:6-pyruvoyltetrahydropterin/6-carboxytetrahydropterin synthase
MILLRRKAHFSAAHRLHNPQKSEQWNQQIYGECGGENWHGHNYKIMVTVAGTPDSETGYIIDLFDLKTIIHEQIIKKCDHKNLNLDVGFLEGIIPSTENLAKVFFNELEEPIAEAGSSSAFLYAVTLEETERNSAVYCPYFHKQTD